MRFAGWDMFLVVFVLPCIDGDSNLFWSVTPGDVPGLRVDYLPGSTRTFVTRFTGAAPSYGRSTARVRIIRVSDDRVFGIVVPGRWRPEMTFLFTPSRHEAPLLC